MTNSVSDNDSFFTLSSESSGLFKEKNSKFHYFAFPVKNEEEIKSHLEVLRKKFFDARHHCYAYSLGKDGEVFRANDDGEPNHSAGDPIIGQIRSFGLTNVLIVVVRYFGGTKLGMSGLIQAYKTSARLAIEENEIVEDFLRSRIRVKFPYSQMNEVMKLIKNENLVIESQEMGLDAEMVLIFRSGLLEKVSQEFEKMEGVAFQLLE
ncbi:YigZ family protein [Algoriphagus kandeliae]|uniref:YigZ family protein n=1 Tax=Algoriphagus kandeliae TaxID=2562278 RepID=A0A4Y9QP49_9BACT|nr:YigZ family protein [Algoriphagus kandeliae]TFV94404.1 YigZ family protein [Algoriphagus kandeliae]